MASLVGFDATEIDPLVGFDPVPEGKYFAVIVESDNKATKAGTGSYLELVFEIYDGEHKGKKVWTRLNLNNANPKAVQIAKAELSSICRSVGVLRPNDSLQLHDKPLLIHVVVKKREDGNGFSNEIKAYFDKQGNPPKGGSGSPLPTSPSNGSAPTPAPTVQASQTTQAPWLRKS